MTTTTAKITVRKGVMNDLPSGPVAGTSGTPKLSAGEFAYATDTRRLFIGNDHTESQALTDGIQDEFNLGVDLDNIADEAYVLTICDLDGSNPVTQTLGTDYTYTDYVITFTSVPANNKRIVLYYLTELLTFEPDKNNDVARTGTLTASATGVTFAGIHLNIIQNDFYEIEYRIKDTSVNAHRRGVLQIGLDVSGTYTINDQYQTSTTALDHSFDIAYSSSNFSLNYTTTYATDCDFSYIVREWQS